MKTVYNFDPKTFQYTGTSPAFESPLEPGVYHYPPNSTTVAVPSFDPQTQSVTWNGERWNITSKEAPQKTYYPYTPVTVGNTTLEVYTGTPLVQDSTLPAPQNASTQPVPKYGTGAIPYLNDTGGWSVGADFRLFTLDDWKAIATRAKSTAFSAAVANLNNSYSPSERASWVQQVTDATAFLGGASPSILLSTLADARDIPVATLAQKIVAKNGVYQVAYAQILGKFQKARDTINATTAASQIPAQPLADVVKYYKPS